MSAGCFLMHFSKADVYAKSRFWIIVEAALEYFIAIVTTGAYLARITKELGFSDSLTGILSAFVSLGCIFQLGSGIVFRGAKRVKPRAILFQLINEFLFVFVYLAPVAAFSKGVKAAVFLVSFFLSYLLYNLIRSEKTNWQLSLIDSGKRGVFTANKEIVSLIGGMIFTFAMGSVIDNMELSGNKEGAFLFCALTIFVLTVLHGVSLILIREKNAGQAQTAKGFREMLSVARDRRILKALTVGVLWNVAYYCSTPFYGAYQINDLAFSMQFISVISIVYSITRAVISPFMGKYADRHSFSRMVFMCFMIAGGGFLVNMFTRPENGKVLYIVYTVFSAVSMAGINSSIVNLIYDFAPTEKRSQAIALNYALSGVVGFLTTCAVSPLVSKIQAMGNTVFGLNVYPAQVVSGISVVVILGLIAYMMKTVLPGTRGKA